MAGNLSQTRGEAIASMYESGADVTAVAEAFGVSVKTLRCCYLPQLRKAGLITRRERPGRAPGGTSERDAELARLYEEGMSHDDLAAKFRITKRTVYERLVALRRAGLVTRRGNAVQNIGRSLAIAAAYNAGTPVAEIAKEFGYANANSINVKLYSLRKQGLLTGYRNAGAAKGKDGTAERHAEAVRLRGLGKTRAEIADILGVHENVIDTIMFIENGRRALEQGLEASLEGGLE